jgi:hypothetical protein
MMIIHMSNAQCNSGISSPLSLEGEDGRIISQSCTNSPRAITFLGPLSGRSSKKSSPPRSPRGSEGFKSPNHSPSSSPRNITGVSDNHEQVAAPLAISLEERVVATPDIPQETESEAVLIHSERLPTAADGDNASSRSHSVDEVNHPIEDPIAATLPSIFDTIAASSAPISGRSTPACELFDEVSHHEHDMHAAEERFAISDALLMPASGSSTPASRVSHHVMLAAEEQVAVHEALTPGRSTPGKLARISFDEVSHHEHEVHVARLADVVSPAPVSGKSTPLEPSDRSFDEVSHLKCQSQAAPLQLPLPAASGRSSPCEEASMESPCIVNMRDLISALTRVKSMDSEVSSTSEVIEAIIGVPVMAAVPSTQPAWTDTTSRPVSASKVSFPGPADHAKPLGSPHARCEEQEPGQVRRKQQPKKGLFARIFIRIFTCGKR